MPARTELGLEVSETAAAVSIVELAELIQDVCYDHDSQGVAADTIKALHKAFRVAKQATIFYWGTNHPLVWDAPEFRFKPKGTK